MDGFDFLRDAFKKFADKVDGQEVGGRLVRSLGAGGKALVERGLEEFPADYIKGMVDDAYALITSPELAEGISRQVRAFDEEKIKEVLDGAVARLKEDDNASRVAKQLKQFLDQADNDQIEGLIEQAIPEDKFSERMIFKAIFSSQVRPVLDEMRGLDEEELAEKIKELADTVPTDFLAMQVGALTREVTPERITAQAHAVVGQLPSGAAIADIVQGVGKSAAKHFDAVAKARTTEEAAKAFSTFTGEATAIVNGTVANDQTAKKKFDKKGNDDFNF